MGPLQGEPRGEQGEEKQAAKTRKGDRHGTVEQLLTASGTELTGNTPEV
jgi:hypothetical protein